MVQRPTSTGSLYHASDRVPSRSTEIGLGGLGERKRGKDAILYIPSWSRQYADTTYLLSSLRSAPISMSATQSVSTFGKKKTATAVAHAKEGKGLIRVNGQPISLVEPQILRWKVYEPVLVVGEDKFS